MAQRVIRDPVTIVLTVALIAIWLVAPVGGATAAPAAPDSAEQYFRALRDRDAGALVDALSPQARRALEARFGLSFRGAVAALFHEQESRNERMIGWEQVGRYHTVQGDELLFYVVRYARGDERRDVPYVLTVGSDGRIERIE
jgi:hypothetical protein